MNFIYQAFNKDCNINMHFSFDVFNAIINLKIVNFYKPWSNMKILMLFHDFDVIGLLFHDFDNHVISAANHIYHGSCS